VFPPVSGVCVAIGVDSVLALPSLVATAGSLVIVAESALESSSPAQAAPAPAVRTMVKAANNPVVSALLKLVIEVPPVSALPWNMAGHNGKVTPHSAPPGAGA
jgi:hypothetical protein